ncbi:hypothetical protein JRQ81_018805 [Phrynocephalus forsythii]|uniref:Uncharacterized protein n=1 Tax=Phrynocephalus forsythii TaxID=171643 RepID=A0A9Q1AZP9_9SAUR|nr:hypothetical protein JRQ81_018805 [Phrynocephalus forsythii]
MMREGESRIQQHQLSHRLSIHDMLLPSLLATSISLWGLLLFLHSTAYFPLPLRSDSMIAPFAGYRCMPFVTELQPFTKEDQAVWVQLGDANRGRQKHRALGRAHGQAMSFPQPPATAGGKGKLPT